MRKVGLHIRIPHQLEEAADYAHAHSVPIFQLFLIDQIARKPLSFTDDQITAFKKKSGGKIPYVHGSYFINLAHLKKNGRKTLEREIQQAQLIGAPYLIMHPGSATGHLSHAQGIVQLATVINELFTNDTPITLVLENTAHGGKSVGSNLQDFVKLKTLLKNPTLLKFCIDTAHAHTYSYDLSTPEKQNEFIEQLEQTIGINAIALIHLNDSYYESGSRIDKHAIFGKGTIGANALQSFILHPKLKHLPLILELPALPFQEEVAILQTINKWHTAQGD